MDTKNKRNFILLGHASCGKTTLSESILSVCKQTTRKGTVTNGTTVSDYNPDEIERKISINMSSLFCEYKGNRIQFIDVPGYSDFLGEVISGLRAIDGAVVVVDGSAGVQLGTERAWELLDKQKLPRIIFINKLDKEGVDADNVLADIKEHISKNCLFIKSLDAPEVIEAVAETDDALLEKYLDGKELTGEEVKNALHNAVLQGKIFPVVSGVALEDKGINELLDEVVAYLPAPSERQPVVTVNPDSQDKKEITLNQDGPFAAFVFKTISDPHIGQLTLLRVFSGKLMANSSFCNVTAGTKERVGSIYMLEGKEHRTIEEASCGDIIALTKLKNTHTADSIGDEKDSYLFEPLVFPEAAISASIKPKTRADEEKISIALSKLGAEDRTLKVSRDSQTKEEIISGMGNLHLEVLVKRLESRFHVGIDLGKPKVPYKETIKKSAKVQGKHKKQSGGRGQYGDVWIEVEPLTGGENDFEFVNNVFGGAITRNYIPAVEKGVRQACIEGALAGYPLINIRVTLYDGSYHNVDSSDMAFQIAGSMALKKAILEAGPALLEPIMDVEIMVPDEFMGHINGDISSRRGRVMGMESKGKLEAVKARIPLSEMFQYTNDLKSMTGGRGAYTMKFADYQEAPQKVSSEIISQYQAQKQQDG